MMTTERAYDQLTMEIINEFMMPRTTCYNFIRTRIEMAYGYGFDKGRMSINAPKQKKIVQYTLDGSPVKLWKSLSEAADALNIDRSQLSKVARGVLKTAGGYRWEYAKIKD